MTELREPPLLGDEQMLAEVARFLRWKKVDNEIIEAVKQNRMVHHDLSHIDIPVKERGI